MRMRQPGRSSSSSSSSSASAARAGRRSAAPVRPPLRSLARTWGSISMALSTSLVGGPAIFWTGSKQLRGRAEARRAASQGAWEDARCLGQVEGRTGPGYLGDGARLGLRGNPQTRPSHGAGGQGSPSRA